MKTKLLFTFCFILSAILVVRAQDVIIKKNGDEIKAKVTEVDVNEVKYKKFENLSGPVYSIAKSDVFMIKYENGDKDMFGKSSEESGGAAQNKIQNTEQRVSANRNTTTAQGARAGSSESSTQNANEYRHKSPAAAFWLSFLYPGIGQFYNGQIGKGITMSVLATSSLVALGIVSSSDYWGDTEIAVAGVSAIVYVGTYIWTLIDAPVSAAVMNRRNQPLSWNLGKDRKLSIVPNVLSDNSKLSNNYKQPPAYGLSVKFDF